MSRGFNITVPATSPDDLHADAIAEQVSARGLLTVVESQHLLPAAVEAAKSLMAVFAGAPCLINFHGVDHTQERGVESDISVTVSTLYTVEELPEPVHIEPPVVETPVSVEPTNPPVGLEFSSAATATFTVGAAGTFEVALSGVIPEIPVVLTQSELLPEGLTFVDNGNGTATLSGTPTAVAAGDFNLIVTAVEGDGESAVTVTQDLALTVAVA